jgi:hypothetical protein
MEWRWPDRESDRPCPQLVFADVPFDALVAASVASIAAKIIAQVDMPLKVPGGGRADQIEPLATMAPRSPA